jgi:DNA helicase IV
MDKFAPEIVQEEKYRSDCDHAKNLETEELLTRVTKLARDPSREGQILNHILRGRLDALSVEQERVFFARITELNGQNWYLGLLGIPKKGNLDPWVIDWRSRLAAGFYESTFENNYGLRSRRRFHFSLAGTIDGWTDDDLAELDGLNVGGFVDPSIMDMAFRDGQMKHVVATIQAEQDKIIRSELEGVLIVQGGPGTGKTVVALHRLAYLIYSDRTYNNSKLLGPNTVLVLGPNNAFIEYIQNVLPTLGEGYVKQSSLISFFECLSSVRKLEDPHDVLLGNETAELLDSTMRSLVKGFQEEVRIAGITIPAEELNSMTWRYMENDRQPWKVRRKNWEGAIVAKFAAHYSLDKKDKSNLTKVLGTAWPKVDARRLIRESSKKADTDLGRSLKQASLLKSKEFSESYPIAVLKKYTEGIVGGPSRVQRYEHVVIDEAQDLSALEVLTIKIYSKESFTLVGDMAQKTRTMACSNWIMLGNHLSRNSPRIEMLSSGYRVPRSVCTIANKLRPFLGVEVPELNSVRMGEPVKILKTEKEQLVSKVASFVKTHSINRSNVAILARAEIHEQLVEELASIDFVKVEKTTLLGYGKYFLSDFSESKGLEFDDVIVVEPFLGVKRSEVAARESYIALSRTVQRLCIVYSNSELDLSGNE